MAFSHPLDILVSLRLVSSELSVLQIYGFIETNSPVLCQGSTTFASAAQGMAITKVPQIILLRPSVSFCWC